MPPHRSALVKSSSTPTANDSTETDGASQTSQYRQKRRSRMPRVVSFGESSVNCVERLHDDSKDSKQRLYYDSIEIRKMQKSVKKIVKAGVLLDDREDSMRGLELYTKQYQSKTTTKLTEQQKFQNVILKLHQLGRKATIVLTDDNQDDSEHDATLRRSAPALIATGSDEKELTLCARQLLRRAVSTGRIQADKDAQEAHAIYLETMDCEQVQAIFGQASSEQKCSVVEESTRYSFGAQYTSCIQE